MSEKKKKLTGQQGELMRALNITVDDLDANDGGFITPQQMETVIERQRYQWMPAYYLTAFFAAMGVFLSSAAFIDEDDVAVLLFVGLAFFLAAGVAMVAGTLKRRAIQTELRRNKMQTTQGIAVANIGEDASYLEINGMKLVAPADVIRRVRHLDPYVVHYLPESKVVLSMEHIPDDDNIRADTATTRLRETVSDSAEELHEMLTDESRGTRA